jgi:hypothetical protein
MRRNDGWWGLAFVIGLFIVSALGSVPTAAESGERIKAFYAANWLTIVVQQILGALLVVPLLAFALALQRRARARSGSDTQRLLIAGCAVAAAELATNVLPIAITWMPEASPGTLHTLTLVADVADATLFVAIAVFSALAALAEATWVRLAGFVVAALTLLRAIASPLGATTLDAAAPILFLTFVFVLSVRMLLSVDNLRSGSSRPAVG